MLSPTSSSQDKFSHQQERADTFLVVDLGLDPRGCLCTWSMERNSPIYTGHQTLSMPVKPLECMATIYTSRSRPPRAWLSGEAAHFAGQWPLCLRTQDLESNKLRFNCRHCHLQWHEVRPVTAPVCTPCPYLVPASHLVQ